MDEPDKLPHCGTSRTRDKVSWKAAHATGKPDTRCWGVKGRAGGMASLRQAAEAHRGKSLGTTAHTCLEQAMC